MLACGRRFGKTTLGEDVLIEPALDGFPVAFFSPTYKMLADVWRDMRNILLPVTLRSNAQEHRLELTTGGVVDMWSLEQPDAARGRKYKQVFVDEAAMVAGLEEAWNAVIRPTLTDYAGGAWFGSTPKGVNFFHTIFARGQDRAGEWMSWTMPTVANPHINPAEVEAARLDLPERTFEQEYLAKFLEDAGGVFVGVGAVATLLAPDAPVAHNGHTCVMGVDWAKQNDWTVLTVKCRTCGVVVDWDRFNKIDYFVQRQRLGELAHKWRVKGILPERNSIGEPNIEMLLRDGLPILPGPDELPGFNTLPSTKPELIDYLRLVIEQKRTRIPKDYALELQAYEMSRNKSTGRPQYSAPAGMHDDRVMSLALAEWAARMVVPLPATQPTQTSRWTERTPPDDWRDEEQPARSRWKV